MILRPALFSGTIAILPFSCFVAFVVGMFFSGVFFLLFFSSIFFLYLFSCHLLMHLLFFSHEIELVSRPCHLFQVAIRVETITKLTKERTAFVVPNAIGVHTTTEKVSTYQLSQNINLVMIFIKRRGV